VTATSSNKTEQYLEQLASLVLVVVVVVVGVVVVVVVVRSSSPSTLSTRIPASSP
jgi:hypothetical protein